MPETQPQRQSHNRARSVKTSTRRRLGMPAQRGGALESPEGDGSVGDDLEMSNEGRYSVFPSWSSTGSSLGDDISEFDGAAQGLVVANPVGTTDELIAVRGNSCGDRPTGESSELSDWRRWREGLGHEGE